MLESAEDEPGDDGDGGDGGDDKDSAATGSGSGLPEPAGAVVSAASSGSPSPPRSGCPGRWWWRPAPPSPSGLLYTVLGGPHHLTEAAAIELPRPYPYTERCSADEQPLPRPFPLQLVLPRRQRQTRSRPAAHRLAHGHLDPAVGHSVLGQPRQRRSSSRCACALAFPLPAVDLGLRLRPLGILRLTVYLLYDMFSSSVEVTRQIFAKGLYPAAVVAVPLRVRSDLMLTATAVAVSNVPGGSVIEVRRSTATLFLHVLDADDPGEIESAQRSVWRMEELVARAAGTAEDIALAAQPVPEGEPSP